MARNVPDAPKERLSLPFAQWPELDRTAWLATVAIRSILDQPSPGAHWSPATKAGVNAAYARWLGWLAIRDPQSLGFPPVERVTRAAVSAYAGELRLSVVNRHAKGTPYRPPKRTPLPMLIGRRGRMLLERELWVSGPPERPSRVWRRRAAYP